MPKAEQGMGIGPRSYVAYYKQLLWSALNNDVCKRLAILPAPDLDLDLAATWDTAESLALMISSGQSVVTVDPSPKVAVPKRENIWYDIWYDIEIDNEKKDTDKNKNFESWMRCCFYLCQSIADCHCFCVCQILAPDIDSSDRTDRS